MALKVEMMVTLTQPGLYISKFRASGKDPSLFSCVRARHLKRSYRNVAGSLGHVTTSLGTLSVGFLCRKQGKFMFVNKKSFEVANVGAGGKPCRGVGQEMK